MKLFLYLTRSGEDPIPILPALLDSPQPMSESSIIFF